MSRKKKGPDATGVTGTPSVASEAATIGPQTSPGDGPAPPSDDAGILVLDLDDPATIDYLKRQREGATIPVHYGVVVEVPDFEQNWSDAEGIVDPEGIVNVSLASDPETSSDFRVRVRVEVWEVGELLILDESEREVSGRCRKPYKWGVGLKVFDRIEDAIACAVHVTDESFNTFLHEQTARNAEPDAPNV